MPQTSSGVQTTDPSFPDEGFEAAFAALPEAMICVRENGTIGYANAIAAELLGFALEDLNGTSVQEISPMWFPASWEEFWEKVSEGQPFYEETVFHRQDGSMIPVDVSTGMISSVVHPMCCLIVRDASTRRQTEQQLRESRERFSNAFEYATVGKAIVDRRGAYIEVNPAFCRMLGYESEEIVGKPFSDFTHPDDLQKDQMHLRKLQEGAINAYQTEKRYLDRAGEPTWALINVSAVHDSQGRMKYMVLETEHISARREAQEELVLSKSLVSSVLNSVADGIVALDAIRDDDGNVIDFEFTLGNAQIETITGTRPDVLIGKRLRRDLPESKSSKEFFDYYVDVVENGTPFDSEMSTEIEGETRWIRFTIVKMRDGIVASFRDVTDERSATQLLKQSERRFRLLAENMTDLVCLHEPDGSYRYVSPSSRRILGYGPEGLRRKVHYDLVHPEDREHVQNVFHDVLTTERQQRIAYRMRTSSGEYRWLEVVVRPLEATVAGGRILSSARDISDRKEAEEELERANKVLKMRNQELQEFAHVASHDLQEPLRKIRSFAELLTSECGEAIDDDGTFYLDRIEDAAERMSGLISDLLTFSRIRTRKQAFESIDLNSVVQDVMSDLALRIAELDSQITCEMLPVIEADRTQMRQLFQNIISNALKFHRDGEPPSISIDCYMFECALSGESMEPCCEISIRDQGIGFQEKYLDRIFTPFQRLHGRSAFEGTGMGLAICRRIVERHNGHLTAESEPGRGSTFVVTLPLHQYPDHSPDAQHENK